jgi:Toprim-like
MRLPCDLQRVVLTKSPIDALSLVTIEGIPQQKTMYLVADSAKILPVEYLRTMPTVIAAYDNDASGNELAQAIADILPVPTVKLTPKLK